MSATDSQLAKGSPDRFGYEWRTYSAVLPESRQQLERWFGSTGLDSCAGKRILDVGCGMGRNPFWMLKAGARWVMAVDVDEQSLGAARSTLGDFPNAEVRNVSAYELSPETVGTFDRVTSIGVVHHLADPERAVRQMWSCVKPGGDLVLWCYAREGNRMTLPFIQTFRFAGARLPIRVTHALAKLVAIGAWPVIRLFPWRTSYYAKLKSLSFGNVESIIFDQMLPRIAHYWTRSEVERLVASLGGLVKVEFVQGNSWHVRVQKQL